MGFFRKLLQVAAPIAGSAFGPVGTAIGAGVSGYMAQQDRASEQEKAGAQAGQTAAGGAAGAHQAGLLGIGGDPSAGFQNYLGSVGYQGQLRAGQEAITSSRAASGLLGSGSTAKALQAYGTQLNAQNFDNYLGQVGGVARQTAQGAPYQYGAGNAAAETRSGGWDALIGGLGTAYDAWSAGRSKVPGMGAPEPVFGAGGIPIPAGGAPRWGG